MTIHFEDPFVEGGSVHFHATSDGGRCSFRVTREVLQDLDEVESLADDDLIGAYRRHAMALQTIALGCMGRGGQAPGGDPFEIGTDFFMPVVAGTRRASRRAPR